MQKPKKYNLTPARGQALLNYQGRLQPSQSVEMQLFETEVIEEIKSKKQDKSKDKETELHADFQDLLLHGDALSACAYLKSKDIKIDLVYIDPPFASGANYAKKVYLRNGNKTEFENDDNSIGEEIMYGDIWQKEDYLNWLYERLLAIREVMSEKASIYVHLDWHIGHYAKIMLDEVFGEENFKNEIIWGYRTGGMNMGCFSKKHDTILFYSKSDEITFNTQYYKSYQQKKYNFKGVEDLWDEEKKQWYHNSLCRDVWEDIYPIGTENSERLDYPTQKPIALLERIIKASSNEGDLIADFFCGSGTTLAVAEKMNRRWIGADLGKFSIHTSRKRMIGV